MEESIPRHMLTRRRSVHVQTHTWAVRSHPVFFFRLYELRSGLRLGMFRIFLPLYASLPQDLVYVRRHPLFSVK